MKAKDLREMSTEALEQELVSLRREQFNLRMQKTTGQDSPTHEHQRVRKDIARIKTVMTEAQAKSSA
ncbi:MAG: 50S ribosomal protein L29 [Pseudomonadota bacterium]